MDRQWAFQGRAVDDEIISIIPLYGLRCKNLSRYFDDNTMAIFFTSQCRQSCLMTMCVANLNLLDDSVVTYDERGV